MNMGDIADDCWDKMIDEIVDGDLEEDSPTKTDKQ